MEEYTEAVTPTDFMKVVDSELGKFGNFKNVKSILMKYMIGGGVPDEQLQKVSAIMIAEVRAQIAKTLANFEGDPVEARAKFIKYARNVKKSYDSSDVLSEIMTSDKKEIDIEIVGTTKEGKGIKIAQKKL